MPLNVCAERLSYVTQGNMFTEEQIVLFADSESTSEQTDPDVRCRRRSSEPEIHVISGHGRHVPHQLTSGALQGGEKASIQFYSTFCLAFGQKSPKT